MKFFVPISHLLASLRDDFEMPGYHAMNRSGRNRAQTQA